MADILEELENHFSWNPFHSSDNLFKPYDIPESDPFRHARFYDMHLAASNICKRLVHVKNLHRNISVIVDEKLNKVREEGITLQPPTAPGFVNSVRRDARMYLVGGPLRTQQLVEDYYRDVSEFCLPIASSLTMHPQLWTTVIIWSRIPECQALASYGASLQFLSLEKVEEGFVPGLVAPELLGQLKKVKAHSNDLATWEIRSVSIKDTDAMLGVLSMALADGEGGFQWRFGSGTPVPGSSAKILDSTRAVDSFETFQLVQEALLTCEEELKVSDNVVSILDDSLKRGGSSMQSVRGEIYLKEGSPDIPWEDETEEETAARAASLARKANAMPWAPPGPGHVASQELIQTVRTIDVI